MKKIITYIILILVVLSCNNIQNANNKKNIDKQGIKMNYKQNDTFSIEMNKIIKEMILFYDSIGSKFDPKILAINFTKEKNDCFIYISKVPCYTPYLKYYTFLDNNLIIIYNIDNECYYDLIDTTKLTKFNGIPFELYKSLFDTTLNYFDTKKKIEEFEKNITKIEGFPNEFFGHYDPFGRKYKIHSKDSLELVFTGYL